MMTEDTEGILDRRGGLSSVMGKGTQHYWPNGILKKEVTESGSYLSL